MKKIAVSVILCTGEVDKNLILDELLAISSMNSENQARSKKALDISFDR
jgi:hypothetical protein